MQSVKAVLFDLDGTLADTAPDLAAALNRLRADHQLTALDYESIREQTSHGANALIKLGFNLTPSDPDFEPLKQQLLDYYANHIADQTRLFKGMDDLLQQLEKQHIDWGIVTNKPARFTLPLLDQLCLSQRAACIVCGDTTAHSKPHPEPLLYACKQLQRTPRECLYVGDAQRDIEAARNAGMPALIAMYGYIGVADQPKQWGADGLINRAEDLFDYLDS